MGGREDAGTEGAGKAGRADRVSAFDHYNFIPAPGWLITVCQMI
jgi:hypothetical protein